MVKITDKTACSGCTACMAVCPVNCISMIRDEQGFLYPSAREDDCIGCNACTEVCERTENRSEINADETQSAFGAYAKDEELRMSSSSGGVFSLLAEDIIKSGGVVIGAAFSDDYKSVCHVKAESTDELAKFRGSKYLQSDMGDMFCQVKDMLDKGIKVLFSGTPCQTDGLKAFLGKDYNDLTLVDFICHGVPSAIIWDKYCSELEQKAGGHLSSAGFRFKKQQNSDLDSYGKTIFRTKAEDPYMRLFLSNYTLRPSCYDCKHKGISRKSDITIADFWGVNQILPGFSDKKGTSLIIVHSQKGKELLERISSGIVITEADPEACVSRHRSAVVSSPKPVDVDDFWKEVPLKTIAQLADSFCPVDNKQSVKAAIKKLPIYGMLKKGSKPAKKSPWA